MEFSETHVFDAPIEKVWAMFTDQASHIAKFESMGHRNIDVRTCEVDDAGLRLVIAREVTVDLPSFAKKVLKPTNTVVSTDIWKDNGDGTYGGTFTADAKGAPIDVHGTTRIEPTADGKTKYTVTTDVKVNVPLIGGKISNFAKGNIEQQMRDEFACGDRWLASH